MDKVNGKNGARQSNGHHPGPQLSVNRELSQKTILVTGATGFLGKVFVSMLLHRHPDVEKVFLLVRDRAFESAKDRTQREIVESTPFEPLREQHGAGFDTFIAQKIEVISGDITGINLGLNDEDAQRVSDETDVIVNSAGLTNFNPNLENALTINTRSSERMLEFIKLSKTPAKLLHVSTAFVAGSVTGPTEEIAPGPTVYPRYDEIGAPLDHRREINDCLAMIKHAELLSQDQERQSLFLSKAREALLDQNIDPDETETLDREIAKQRRTWIRNRLSKDGRERAEHWGWVNIYTYTKSLGERVLVEDSGDVDVVLFRPAIIESAVSYPKVGWNEGTNTTAPICYLIWKGHRSVPANDVALDIIPIDMTCGAMMTMCAALLTDQYHDVYHIGSSDRNPISVPRCIELGSLATRRLLSKDTKTPPLQKFIRKTLDGAAVDRNTYNRTSMPQLIKATRGLQGLIKKVPTKQLGGIGKALEVVSDQSRKAEQMALTIDKIMEIFEPFIYDNDYLFRARNIEALRALLPEEERATYGCVIEDLDWHDYWLHQHYPGLIKYVFDELETKLRRESEEGYRYRSITHLFDASVKNFPQEIAFQFQRDETLVERWTYAEVAFRVEHYEEQLREAGLKKNNAVILAAENHPLWPMAYFATLKADGVAVPIDHESTTDQIERLFKSSNAALAIVSDAVAERLREEQFELPFVTMMELAKGPVPTILDVEPSEELLADEQENRVASLIFTSGTTGEPKGVKLSHQNFTALLASMSDTFRIDHRDGFLSVLPLHHTFEFTCGFLMPFSRGAAVTYIEELSGEELRAAMKNTKITALIGVPALWQLLNRRVQQNLDTATTKFIFERLNAFNQELRQKTGINIGPTVFSQVHQAFGSRMRYMISGGAALPDDILKTFYGMGFDMYEGYGLTEAAPVLTVNQPRDGLRPGSVGKALPGIEIKIENPDDQGVGEVLARGDNVMLGYLGRDEESEQTLKDGWLHTGDLGVIDKRGGLTIVGRSKEVIVTSGGKNIYPDELDEMYGRCPDVLELSVVGLPDGQGSERVACLVHLDPDSCEGATLDEIAELQQRVREWFRVEGGRAPAHQRIQVLKFWDDDLPRTATRKVKRKDVIAIIERLNSREVGTDDAKVDWLVTTLSNMTGLAANTISDDSFFQDDLGFDSLMVVELASILAEREIPATAESLTTILTVGALRKFIASDAKNALVRSPTSALDRVDELPIPTPIAKAGKDLLHRAQMTSYGKYFDVEVYGQANIPYHDPNVIVVSNHSSHLDMGLVKYALGDFGADIRALAAADYFFKNTTRKTYFKNFTNLIPLERSGNPRQALGPALEALQLGETILMFPEGTRAKDGKIREFRRGLGYLAVEQRVNILPVYVEGTYRALPKGKTLPSLTSRKLKVRIGKPIPIRELIANSEFDSQNALYEFVSKHAYESVVALSQIGEKTTNKVALDPLFDELRGKFEQGEVDAPVSFYFSLGQLDASKWTVLVDPDTCEVYNGKPDGSADCVVKTSPEIFRRIVQERYIPSMDEFFDGTIKTNAPDLLMRFQAVFRLQD